MGVKAVNKLITHTPCRLTTSHLGIILDRSEIFNKMHIRERSQVVLGKVAIPPKYRKLVGRNEGVLGALFTPSESMVTKHHLISTDMA